MYNHNRNITDQSNNNTHTQANLSREKKTNDKQLVDKDKINVYLEAEHSISGDKEPHSSALPSRYILRCDLQAMTGHIKKFIAKKELNNDQKHDKVN